MEYTWKITGITTKDIEKEGHLFSNAVVEIKWKVSTEGSDGVVSREGATPYPEDIFDVDPASFVTLDALTEDTLLEWVKLDTKPYLSYIEDELAEKLIKGDFDVDPVVGVIDHVEITYPPA